MATPAQAGDELRLLGARFKEAGDGGKGLRKEMLAAIRASAKGTIVGVRASALATLPNRGGLNERVAKAAYGVRTRLTGKSAGVQIKGTGKGGARSLRAIDEGTVRHPIYGNRKVWVNQSVSPGYFSEPVQNDIPKIRDGIHKAMSDTAAKITRGI